MYSHWPLFWFPLDEKKNKVTQITDHIIQLIKNGEISPGTQLPPVTLLGKKLRVAHGTVKRAYDALKEHKYLATSPGKGTYVAGDEKSRQLPDPGWPAHSPFSYCTHQLVFAPAEAAGYIPFACAGLDIPDVALVPSRKILNFYESGIAAHSRSGRYHSSYETLINEGIQQILQRRDIAAQPDQALIVPHRHALYMVVITLGIRGKRVVMASPADTRVQSVFHAAGAQLLFTGVDNRGMITEQLEKFCESTERDIRVVFVRSSGEFPNCAALSEDRRRRLLELAMQYNFVIVALDEDHEFWHKRALAPLVYRQHKGHIIHISPVSKLTTQFWMNELVVANRDFIEALSLSIHANKIHYNPLELHAIFRLARTGVLDEGIRKVMAHYRVKLNAIEDLFRLHLSHVAELSLPKAGLSLWITFRKSVEAGVLYELLEANGFSRITFFGDCSNQLLNGLHLSFGSQVLESFDKLFLQMKVVLRD